MATPSAKSKPVAPAGDGKNGAKKASARAAKADAVKREQLEYWLGHFAQTDLLTELPNRSQLVDRLNGAIARAVRSRQLVGVVLLNIDRFRSVNATYGHEVADRVLRTLGERLKECTRKSDTAARMGGDEFAIILEGLAEQQGATIATQRLLATLARAMEIDGREIAVTVTVGVAFYPADGDSVDLLLQNADAAMVHAKENNRGTCQSYSPALHQQSRHDESRRATVRQRLASLTPREREVLEILVAGNANKMIAYMLGTSTRTIENHRARIMDKMDAHSLPELVRMVLDADVTPRSAPQAPSAAQRTSR